MTQATQDLLAGLEAVGAALAEGRDRYAVYSSVQEVLGRLVGHRLFTLLVVLPGQEEVQRFWSSNETAYPTSGRKRIGSTPWGRHVLASRQAYLGRNAADIRWAFFDHELIASLGLASVINIPVVLSGRTLGTMNLLDVEGRYEPRAVATAQRFAPYLVAPFRDEAEALDSR